MVKIGVKNIGLSFIENCSIRLDDIYDKNGKRVANVPTGLERLDGKGPFSLRPDEQKLAYVASLPEDHKTYSILLRMFKERKLIRREEHTVVIGAYAPVTKSCVKRFKLFVDEDGLLQMQPDNQPAQP